MGLINLLLTLLVVGFLIAHVPKKYWDLVAPTSPAKQQKAKEAKQAPDRARMVVWETLGQQVSTSVQTYVATYSRKPARYEDLAQVGLDTSRKDPWGGRLHIQGNRLRSTANPQVSYRLW